MNRKIFALILLVIILCLFGIAFFYWMQVFEDIGPPKPNVYSYKEGSWEGLYAFGFSVAQSAESTREGFLVVMDHQGNYVSFENSSQYMFDYIYQLGESEIFAYLRPSNRSDRRLSPEAIIWNWFTGESRNISYGRDISGHHELLIEDG